MLHTLRLSWFLNNRVLLDLMNELVPVLEVTVLGIKYSRVLLDSKIALVSVLLKERDPKSTVGHFNIGLVKVL